MNSQKTYNPQIGKFIAAIAQAMPEIPAGVMQDWIQDPKALKKALKKVFLEEKPNQFTVTVTGINRRLKPGTVIDRTGRAGSFATSVLAKMPRCTEHGPSVELVFFKLSRYRSPVALQQVYETLGLVPDPYALAKYVQDNPDFADKYPCAIQWIDADFKPCYLAFNRWGGAQKVIILLKCAEWNRNYWFAGVPKA